MKRFILLLTCLSCTLTAWSQTKYEKGWQSLHNAQVDEAINHFNSALKGPQKESARLSLALLYSHSNKEDQAAELLQAFMKDAKDPYPELYSLWFEEGLIGESGKRTPAQYKNLETIYKRADNKGKLDGGATYRMYLHYLMSAELEKAHSYSTQVKNIIDWQLLGPFDNVMNSGYNKDFGALDNPKSDAVFSSKYGAEVSWFTPNKQEKDCYLSKDMYFRSNNSIVYAQTYVESESGQDVIVKFGYSGSLKLWINDDLVYEEAERRKTEMDYFRYKCKLNKGYNRILVQLGEYNESYPNFNMRISDLNDNLIVLSASSSYQPYKKGLTSVEPIPFFALEALKKKASGSDPLYQILLAKAYIRSMELDKAEEILEAMIKKHPKDNMALKYLIEVYLEKGDETNFNKYYEIYKGAYPEDPSVLGEKMDEAMEEGDKEKVREIAAQYLKKYETPYEKLSLDVILASLDEDIDKIIAAIDKLYEKFPEDEEALSAKYNLLKSYQSEPKKANKLLEKFLETNYNYGTLRKLVGNYFEEGDSDKAKALLEHSLRFAPEDTRSYRSIASILTRASKYKEALSICEDVLKHRPSDYLVMEDMATLYTNMDDKKNAIRMYEQSLKYFPFSVETNEKIRELKGQTKGMDIVESSKPEDIITEFEKNFKPEMKSSYDIVSKVRSIILFKSKAKGIKEEYILRMNDESAIEDWQHMNFSPESFSILQFDEVQTIKKNGQKIDADRRGGEVVFTNLEVGDYVYVSYKEKQVSGGKSSSFISDKFATNSYLPHYNVEYNLLVEEGLKVKTELIRNVQKPKTSKKDGFTRHHWQNKSPKIVKDETYPLPFYDLADAIHVSMDYEWKDIVQWYSDLSSHQATPDFTIKKIVSDLFDGKKMSQEEKARTIYEFVCKNIQYSSVDFRQSGFIPQKASSVYHARLGDCKDVSTLYASIAREAGIDVNLVLINTRDNGQQNVVLPSLNFNHCIVKVYLDNGAKYLELTDPDLPYGHLYYSHEGAAILEIPTGDISNGVGLEYLKINEGFDDEVIRNTTLDIGEDFKMNIKSDVVKKGIRAAGTVNSYYYIDDKLKRDKIKQSISNFHQSSLTITSLDYEVLKPRAKEVKYKYSYVVDKDVLKLGSLRSVKVPFSDILVSMNIFEDEERANAFNFMNYENTDKYEEKVLVKLGDGMKFKEIPENISAQFKGCNYDLKFKKVNDSEMEIHRIYTVNRQNIEIKDFATFKDFMTVVNEGENSYLLFQ